MSETETEQSDGANPAVSDVLDALAPLTERMDTLAGFAVKRGRLYEMGHPPDPDVVEVHITLAPPRVPWEADHAMAMLRDAGFSVKKVKRGGESTVRVVLRVRSDTEEPKRTTGGPGGQATF